MGTGVFLLVFSVVAVVIDASNPLIFALAFFIIMVGIMLVMVGAMGGFEDKKKDATQTHTEVVREIVKVRCKYCSSLNPETNQRCSNCGGQL